MMYGIRSNGKQHGVVLTKKCVVEAMLDFVGYNPSRDLSLVKITEPSAGEGAFAIQIIKRLYESSLKHEFDFNIALENIKLYEIEEQTVKCLTENLASALKPYKASIPESMIILGDFLTQEVPFSDIIIGNPPYVRHENIPEGKKEVYRKLFQTFKHRSDLYIPFYEKGLKLLKENGKLSFICSNRWLKNQYGENLRRLISHQFALREVIDLENTAPFEESVIAYPAITTISKISGNDEPHYYKLKSLDELKLIPGQISPSRKLELKTTNWFSIQTNGEAYPEYLDTISNQGFKIGIGVATGCDKVFIRDDFEQIVEKELLLPLLISKDVRGDNLAWGGRFLLNPFDRKGELIALDNYPKAKEYLNSNSELLRKRHIAKKRDSNWFRTIDKVDPDLTHKPKIILPDISGNKLIFIDEGNYYPHHNLYYVTGQSKTKLMALAAILMSDFVKNQLSEVGNKMNGGYPRWQSQNLKKLRVPVINSFPDDVLEKLVEAYDKKDIHLINDLMVMDEIAGYKTTKGQLRLFDSLEL